MLEEMMEYKYIKRVEAYVLELWLFTSDQQNVGLN
jgi:hypothetical protein